MRIWALLLMVTALSAQDRFMAPLPSDSAVQIRRDIVYSGPLVFDLYLPTKREKPVGVVVFVNGIGANWMRSHVQYTGWARAVTARGLAGITMDSREASVDDDVKALLAYLKSHAAELGVDASRIALWSCSANVRRGLPLVQMLGSEVRSGVAYYGTGETKDFRLDRPVLFVRAGLDNPGLNRAIDGLVAQSLRDNAPVELLNVASATHGFDIRDDAEFTRAAISRTLDFLEATLRGPLTDSIVAGAPLASAAGAVFREDWKAAADSYTALSQSRPTDPIVWQRLGEAKRALGDRAGALAAFEKAIANGTPNRGIVGFAVARLQAEAGEIDKVFATLEGMRNFLRFFAAELRTAPVFEPVRRDPRYEPLIRDVPAPPR